MELHFENIPKQPLSFFVLSFSKIHIKNGKEGYLCTE